jgi:predicted permease
MTYVIVHALAPIFLIMLLGFWAGKAKMVDNKNVSLLNIFVMDFALPPRCSAPPYRRRGRVSSRSPR